MLDRVLRHGPVAGLPLEVVLKVLVTQLIAILKVPILFALLLNGVIGQVGEHVVWVGGIDAVGAT